MTLQISGGKERLSSDQSGDNEFISMGKNEKKIHLSDPRKKIEVTKNGNLSKRI